MQEIFKNLYIGKDEDFRNIALNIDGWAIIHACKEPYHRQLLGYRTQGAPKNHPEYFYAIRNNVLYLNLVDAPKAEYVPQNIINQALLFAKENLEADKKVLIHCNQGQSRSAGIGLLFLLKYTNILQASDFASIEKEYIKIYPYYNPGSGMRDFLMLNFKTYKKGI